TPGNGRASAPRTGGVTLGPRPAPHPSTKRTQTRRLLAIRPSLFSSWVLLCFCIDAQAPHLLRRAAQRTSCPPAPGPVILRALAAPCANRLAVGTTPGR